MIFKCFLKEKRLVWAVNIVKNNRVYSTIIHKTFGNVIMELFLSYMLTFGWVETDVQIKLRNRRASQSHCKILRNVLQRSFVIASRVMSSETRDSSGGK